MVATPALAFADVARRLGAAARAAGLVVPGFRSPPRLAGAARTIRRYPSGSVVSVQIRNRPFRGVVADMVEGVLVANQIEGEARVRLRTSLHEAVAGDGTGRAAA
ncbi:MAG TPA: hypothetical protein VFF40_14770 [Acidimicrobiia bacterium]|nr:hypothetical protein [Acidimicrobiia bacterium]